MKIAICDGNIEDRQLLHVACAKYFHTYSTSVDFVEFSNAHELLQAAVAQSFQLVLLEAALPDRDGLKTAQELRQDGYTGDLVFVAQDDRYALESYEVKALHYLLKPIAKDKLAEALERVDAKAREDAGALIEVVSSRVKRRIPVRDILWMEAGDHCAVLHTTKEILRVGRLLSDLHAEISGSGAFVKCNRGSVVNVVYVERCDNEFVYLINGDKVLLNLRNSRKIRQQIHDCLW